MNAVATEGVSAEYWSAKQTSHISNSKAFNCVVMFRFVLEFSSKCSRAEILPEFFKQFWVRRMALDRRNYKQLVETTVELALKVLECQAHRKMVFF